MKLDYIVVFYERCRFFITPFFLACALGFYADLNALIDEFYDSREQTKNLSLHLEEKEGAFQKVSALAAQLKPGSLRKENKPLRAQLIELANARGCKLINLRTEFKALESPIKGSQDLYYGGKRLFIVLNLEGDFLAFYHFLEELMRLDLPLRLELFDLKTQNDRLSMVLQFSAFPGVPEALPKITRTPVFCCERDPFREPTNFSARYGVKQDQLQAFPLEELRYVGYLAEKGREVALLLLPNGQIDEAYPGSQLGKEGWFLRRLDSKTLFLEVEDSDQRRQRQLRRF
jgi:hypothetical protein